MHITDTTYTCTFVTGKSNLCVHIIDTTISHLHVDGEDIQFGIDVFFRVVVILIFLKEKKICIGDQNSNIFS